MTDNEKRIAIGKFCGRKPGVYYCSQCKECVPIEEVTSGGYHRKPDGGCGGTVHRDLPDYLNDLNAQREVFEKMDGEQKQKFSTYLLLLAEQKFPWLRSVASHVTAVESLTPKERADCILRAIGKETP
jgi:hypothetical protein